ncbi:M16 family metallopeptidase [Chengkuizengella marina]|uniref:Insulinase family protein n=1 Tax=Chengkuizengella marina TaxID=2507566 RepID=A0A6N9PX66_9BACL|nr:pitrilysin family protein [Chengkuizengella marina]NBI27412.1 insulinase family protein [Chengkuizengella marina]
MKKHHLKNGLRVITEKIPACRSVSFGIWVKTGSRNEGFENNGISHFIEHMLFKGTDQYSAAEIADTFDSIGGNVNAFTSKEYTCYYTKVLDEHLDIALEVLSSMFLNSTMDPNDLIKEKNVIYEEISMYDDTPDELVHDLVTTAAYKNHPLAYPILGTNSILENLHSEDLIQYMKSHYHINNTVISVAGNIDDLILEKIEKYFGEFSGQGQSLSPTPPSFEADQLFHYKDTEQNHICLTLPGCSLKDHQLFTMTLLNNYIGGGMSSRLFQEIRENRGLAYSVYSYHSAFEDSGLFTIYMGSAPKQTNSVLDVTMKTLESILLKGMSTEQLKKSKEQLKGSLILSLESTSSRMNRLGKNELMMGKHLSLDEIINKIESVTTDDVNSLLSKMFSTPFAVAMVGQKEDVFKQFRRDRLVI